MSSQSGKTNKWLIYALIAILLGLVVYSYYLTEKVANSENGRAKTEEFVLRLEAEKDSLNIELYNERQKKEKVIIQKQTKILYREKIRTIIDTISNSELVDRFRANGFHPVLPCK